MVVEETDTLWVEPRMRHSKCSIGWHLHESELGFGYEMKVISIPNIKEVLFEWVVGMLSAKASNATRCRLPC